MRRFTLTATPRLSAALVALILAAATLAAALAPAAAQVIPCPNSDVRLFGQYLAQYPSAVLDTSFTIFPGGTYSASYNLITGTLSVEKPIPSSFGYEYVIARDRYDITGLPPGTVVPFTVNLDVNGYVQSANTCGGAGCSGFFGARLMDLSTTVEQSVNVGYTGRADLVQTLPLPVSITVGTPILLQYQLYYFVQAGGDGYGGIGQGAFRFTGLPAGATLVSCQGYSTAPVPVRSTSWGRLKTIYR